jgi:hypothetical protein
LAGIAIYNSFIWLGKFRYPAVSITLAAIYIAHLYYPIFNETLPNFKKVDVAYITIGDYIKDITEEDEFIVVADHDWSSHVLYYAERKGFMLKFDGWETHPILKKHNFTTVVTRLEHPKLLANWKHHKLMKTINTVKIYKVSDDIDEL